MSWSFSILCFIFVSWRYFFVFLNLLGPPFIENCSFGRRDRAGQTRLEKLVRREKFSHRCVKKTTQTMRRKCKQNRFSDQFRVAAAPLGPLKKSLRSGPKGPLGPLGPLTKSPRSGPKGPLGPLGPLKSRSAPGSMPGIPKMVGYTF